MTGEKRWKLFGTRLSVADIELARDIASRRGTGYQTVLKEAIRYGLRRAG
jgi:predicted DNA binding CopG/RHH family protein